MNQGIHGSNSIIIKLDDKIEQLSIEELFHKLSKDKKQENIQTKNLEVVGINNNFVKVNYICRNKVSSDNHLYDIRINGGRGFIVSNNYPCVIYPENNINNKSREYTIIKSACKLNKKDNILIGNLLQTAYSPSVLKTIDKQKGIIKLLENKNDFSFRQFSLSPVCSKNTLEFKYSHGVVYSLDISDEYLPYYQLNGGIILHA